MSRTRTSLGLSIVCLAFLLSLSACSKSDQGTNAQGQPSGGGTGGSGGGLLSKLADAPKPITIAQGTEIGVLLDHAINSEQQKSGDSFTATVAEPVVVDGKTVVPKGARVTGTIVEAKASGRLKGVAQLRLALRSIEVGGKEYNVETSTVARTGQNHNKRNAVAIGGGAGAGALIGGLAGGGKGAAIGAAVGAGAGTAGAAATGKKDIMLAPETRINFTLAQPVTIPVKG